MEEDEVVMIECKTLDDFVRLNDDDVRRIIISKFRNVLHTRFDVSFEDLLQSFYLHIAKSGAVEKYDPEFGVKFSTYMFRCIHNFMCAFHIHRTQRDNDFYGTDSLDKNMVNETFTKHDVIATPEIEGTHDILAVYDKLKEYDKKYKYKSKIKYAELFKLYWLGYKDADIGRKYKMTSAGIGARKRNLAEIVGPFVGRDVIL